MTEMLIGYARVSTGPQDLTAQRNALEGLRVAPVRVYLDQGRSDTNRDRPGLARALAACRRRSASQFPLCVPGGRGKALRPVPHSRQISSEFTLLFGQLPSGRPWRKPPAFCGNGSPLLNSTASLSSSRSKAPSTSAAMDL